MRSFNNFKVINLGSGEGVSVIDIIRIIEKISRKNVKYRFENRRPGEPPILVADIKLAKEFLSWVPKNSNIDGIISTALGWHQR